jgi:gamma-glutamyltranspeptidase/glutathione hydrolase
VPFATRPEVRGNLGVVSSTHWLASAAGLSMLERGGNAFDACVAAGLTLQVVEPHFNGLGGEVATILWSAAEKKPAVICGQGSAPARLTVEAIRGLGLRSIPGNGLLGACVPGAFGAWMTLLRDFGSLALRDVLEPGIAYAETGYPVLHGMSSAIATMESYFRSEWPTSAEIYLPDGIPLPGSRFRNPVLAGTYRRLLGEAVAGGGNREKEIERALAAYYRGFVAEAVAAFVERQSVLDATGEHHRGFLTGGDFADWVAAVEDPVGTGYGAFEVLKPGPWSQGPVFLQQLGLLERFQLPSGEPISPDRIHLSVEAAKLALADREAWYGDPHFASVPLAGLLDKNYAARRAALIADRASDRIRPGDPDQRQPRLPWLEEPAAVPADRAGIGEPTFGSKAPAHGDTCHVAAVDRQGNLVAATPSGGWLQGSPVVSGLGFGLGSRAQIFNLEPGLPNCLEPGKRPRTTLSPTLVLRDGEPYLAFGTPGGDNQDQWTLTFFLNHATFGLSLQESADAATFYTSHVPNSFDPHEAHPGRVHIESRVGADTVTELERRGHEVIVEKPWTMGRVCAVGIEPDTGFLRGAAGPRGMQAYCVAR